MPTRIGIIHVIGFKVGERTDSTEKLDAAKKTLDERIDQIAGYQVQTWNSYPHHALGEQPSPEPEMLYAMIEIPTHPHFQEAPYRYRGEKPFEGVLEELKREPTFSMHRTHDNLFYN